MAQLNATVSVPAFGVLKLGARLVLLIAVASGSWWALLGGLWVLRRVWRHWPIRINGRLYWRGRPVGRRLSAFIGGFRSR